MADKPPTIADLTWTGDRKFSATINNVSMTLDSAGRAGPSPVDALVGAVAGCMMIHLVDILTKGRHPLRGVRAHLVAERAPESPRRVVRMTLHFTIDGPIDRAAIERAVALSRDSYCSVWHSMRQDIGFAVTFDAPDAEPVM